MNPSKTANTKPVVAVHKINGKIPPGLVFVPESVEHRTRLIANGAAREPTDSEIALFEKVSAGAAAAATPAAAAAPEPVVIPEPAPAAGDGDPLG